MQLKNLALLALTTCTLIVIGTGIAKAIFIPESSFSAITATAVLAQSVPEEQATPPEVEAINQATLEYLKDGREDLPETPSITRTVVDEGYAIATWTWGEAGGQSVLSLTDEIWTVIASGGGAVDVSVLVEAGVPTDIAERLIERDQATWEERKQ
ncbi:MAG: hypothetical protein AAFV90_25350 [Cyanobacteria bacterium J06634_5]